MVLIPYLLVKRVKLLLTENSICGKGIYFVSHSTTKMIFKMIKSITAIFSLTLLLTSGLSAQSAYEKAVTDVCNCLDQKSDAYADANSLQLAMTECIQGAIMKDPITILSEKNITDPTDIKAMTKFGEEINSDLMDDCPAHLDGMKQLQMSAMMGGGGPKSVQGSAKGKLVAISDGAVTVLRVEDPLGKATEVLWLSSFSGDSELIASPQKYLNQNVVLNYSTTKVYNAKSKSYKDAKELTGISLAQK